MWLGELPTEARHNCEQNRKVSRINGSKAGGSPVCGMGSVIDKNNDYGNFAKDIDGEN